MLEISFPAMVTTIIVFLALISFLNKKLYKPLLAHMEARDRAIKNDEESAMKNAQDVDSNKAEIAKVLDAARAEASKIKQEAIETAKEVSNKELAEQKAKLEADFAKFSESLNEQKASLKSDLSAKIPDFKSGIKNALSKI